MLARSGFKALCAAFNRAAAVTVFSVLAGFRLCMPEAMAAQLFAVDLPQKSAPDAPRTLTLLYGVENPQITVILIPGGEGYLRFKEGTTSTRHPSVAMLQYLTQADFSKLRTNVVIMDSPGELYPLSRRKEADHLDRIENTVLFYKKKFNTPIWLIGHSNGSISVTEFINRSAEARALVAGIISSGGRYEIEIKDGMNLPVLFLHHERDGCKTTPYSYARSNFEKTRTRNKGVTELSTVKGGEEKGDPCSDGRHMYLGAYEEAAKLIEQFLSQNSPGGQP
jgi:hypothetical protein